MSVEPYALCPCGSGKQFKWCCTTYYPLFIKALEQEERGQKATARQTIDSLTEKFAEIPQAWCYRADFLARTGERSVAEESVEKALQLNPELPFANFMKGMFRLEEGETTGAILLFRRAAERFSPESKPMIAEVFSRIAQIELQENRPVASLAALRRSLEALPNDAELRTSFEAIFGKESRLLAAAKHQYELRQAKSEAEQNAAQEGINLTNAGRWSEGVKLLDAVAKQFPESATAQFNLGLVRAWLGDNRRAIDSLVKSAELSDDLQEQTQAIVLAEVLRGARGLESISDYTEHRYYLKVLDGPAFAKLFNSWATGDRLIVMDSDEENSTMSALVLESSPLLGANAGPRYAALQAYLVLDQDLVRIWHPSKAKVDQLLQEIRTVVGKGISEPQYELGASQIGDVLADLMVFPLQEEKDPSVMLAKRKEASKKFFEENWIQRSLQSLGGGTPLDASTHPTLKKRLPGLIRYFEESFYGGQLPDEAQLKESAYDFNRLKKKLGLDSAGTSSEVDFETIDIAGLATLNVKELTLPKLTQAFQAAVKLDSPELAGKFATQAIGIAEGDRYPFFQHLISLARQENLNDRVLELLKAGYEADSQSNGGQRSVQYRILTGQAIARSGNTDLAYDHFKQAIRELPNELGFYGPATEAMLSKNQGAKAMEFATAGLTLARSQNNRAAEEQFLELSEAAKKRGG